MGLTSLVANKPRRRRRKQARSRHGKFMSNKRRKGSRRRRSYADNWFVLNKKRGSRRRKSSRRRRKSYADNWFVLNKKRRKSSRRRRHASSRRRRSFADNMGGFNPMNILNNVMSSVRDMASGEFLMGTALPLVGGVFLTRGLVGVGAGALGIKADGLLGVALNLVGAALAGAVVSAFRPDWGQNVMLGGVVATLVDGVKNFAKDVAVIKNSPALSQAFGVSGLGLGTDEDVRKAVEREVMKELGVGDFLSSEQLGRSERINGLGGYLTSENLSVAERIGGMGQYPRETSGYLGQYPRETSGMADVSDFADVSSVGEVIG